MKPQGFSLLAAQVIIVCGALFASAQNYKIDWYTIDSAGGTSSGGPYSLSGTIGQPDAGKLSGGSFVLDGGFWGGVFAVQQVGAPTLRIVRSGSSVTISWDPVTPGFVLQEVGTLTSPAWMNSLSGSANPVTVPATNFTRFYRLINPQ
jgi:hypothetical protein